MPILKLSKANYEFETLVRVAHRLGAQLSIQVESMDDYWELEWSTPKELETKSIERVRNEVYEQILRDKIHAETKPIRDVIFAAAFSNIEIT